MVYVGIDVAKDKHDCAMLSSMRPNMSATGIRLSLYTLPKRGLRVSITMSRSLMRLRSQCGLYAHSKSRGNRIVKRYNFFTSLQACAVVDACFLLSFFLIQICSFLGLTFNSQSPITINLEPKPRWLRGFGSKQYCNKQSRADKIYPTA